MKIFSVHGKEPLIKTYRTESLKSGSGRVLSSWKTLTLLLVEDKQITVGIVSYISSPIGGRPSARAPPIHIEGFLSMQH